jgi:hypothetical protein
MTQELELDLLDYLVGLIERQQVAKATSQDGSRGRRTVRWSISSRDGLVMCRRQMDSGEFVVPGCDRLTKIYDRTRAQIFY